MVTKKALTVGEIARRLSCPIHRVEYLIRTRKIEAVERAGNLRVFSDDVMQVLRNEMKSKNSIACAT